MNKEQNILSTSFYCPTGLCENTVAHVYVVAQVALVQGHDIILFKDTGFHKPSQ